MSLFIMRLCGSSKVHLLVSELYTQPGLDWRERKLIWKLYMGHRFYSRYPAITLPRNAFKGLGI